MREARVMDGTGGGGVKDEESHFAFQVHISVVCFLSLGGNAEFWAIFQITST